MFTLIDIFHVFDYFTTGEGGWGIKLAGAFLSVSLADVYGHVVAGRHRCCR